MEARDMRLERPGPLCAGAFLAWAVIAAVDAQERRVHIRVCAAFPRWVFAMSLLATPLRTLHTPLLTELLNAGRKTPLGWGFLTLDLGRRVVCLLETDDLAQRVPIVGVWLDLVGCMGQEQTRAAAFWDAAELLDNPIVWAAASRFVQSKRIGERVWVGDKTFLIMVVHHTACDGHSSADRQTCSSFFEAQYSDTANQKVLLAPADGPQAFSIDLPLTFGSDTCSLQPLSVRSVPLTDVVHAGRRSENPEEDVPERVRPSWTSCQGLYADPARTPCLRDSKTDMLFANLEKPRAMPPRPHPGPGQFSMGGLAQTQNTLSLVNPQPPNSPERSGGREFASRQPLEHVVPALENTQEVKNSFQELDGSTHRRDLASIANTLAGSAGIDELRLSNAARDLQKMSYTAPSPSALPLESCPTSALGTRLEDVMRGRAAFGSKLEKAAVQPDGDENLRKLVTMQQVQLTEMQRQISDLHALVAGMAKGSQLRPTSCAIEAASDARPAASALEVATSTSPEVDFQHGGSLGSRCTAQLEPQASPVVLTSSLGAAHHKTPRLPTHQETQVGQSLELAAASVRSIGAACCRDAAVNTSMDRAPTWTRSCSTAVNTSLEFPTSQGAVSSQCRTGDEKSAWAPEVAKKQAFCGDDSRLAAVWEAPTATTPATGTMKAFTSSQVSEPLGCDAGTSEESDVEELPLTRPDSLAVEYKASTVAYMRDSADSADTAGGATPRKPTPTIGTCSTLLPATAVVAATTPPAGIGNGSTSISALHQDVPRILWPPSPSSCACSDSSLEDDGATSDVGSIDSSPALGMSLGLGGYGASIKAHHFS